MKKLLLLALVISGSVIAKSERTGKTLEDHKAKQAELRLREQSGKTVHRTAPALDEHKSKQAEYREREARGLKVHRI